MRGVVKGKRWLLLTRWMNLDSQKRRQLTQLFALNRRVMKAYLLKESLERLWTYRYEGHAALSARLDRSTAMATIATLSKTRSHAAGSPRRHPQLLPHKVRFGMVEAINGNIKTLLRRGAATRIWAICCSRPNAWRPPRPNSSSFRKPPKMRVSTNSCAEPNLLRPATNRRRTNLFHSQEGGGPDLAVLSLTV